MNPSDVAPALVAITLFVSVAVLLILRGPLGRALARRLEGQAGDAGLRDELEDLRSRVLDAEALAARVAELEERVEFSERLLARQGQAQQLPRVDHE